MCSLCFRIRDVSWRRPPGAQQRMAKRKVAVFGVFATNLGSWRAAPAPLIPPPALLIQNGPLWCWLHGRGGGGRIRAVYSCGGDSSYFSYSSHFSHLSYFSYSLYFSWPLSTLSRLKMTPPLLHRMIHFQFGSHLTNCKKCSKNISQNSNVLFWRKLIFFVQGSD